MWSVGTISTTEIFSVLEKSVHPHPLSVRVVIEEMSIYADFQNNFTNEKFLYLEKFSNLETRKINYTMNIFEH